jgi:hypothetical protein
MADAATTDANTSRTPDENWHRRFLRWIYIWIGSP